MKYFWSSPFTFIRIKLIGVRHTKEKKQEITYKIFMHSFFFFSSIYLLSNLQQDVNHCNYGTINRQDFVLKITFSVGNSCIIQKILREYGRVFYISM